MDMALLSINNYYKNHDSIHKSLFHIHSVVINYYITSNYQLI